MQRTGIIRDIQPDGDFVTAHGRLYAFKMTIEDEQGMLTGGINSKSASYPLVVGQEIIVEAIMNAEHGMKFKKVNPQFEGGGGGSQQAPSGAQQAAEGRNFDKEARGKIMTLLVAAAIQGGQIHKGTSAEDQLAVETFLQDWTKRCFATE